ncbi:hypothetical protein [Streptomyces albipurpureus]|uniref:Uncharacterized protein n=1 Tax=Streptomyces albipurpureus TaxID=2897419 RepID=A0ABT0UJX3_9ACTN|nr:hypothetical protein [Streptomyces sp. CWNU-1]MCM2388803.1 hypothetical protein [Streptomyces sp. CWNU-1]
MAERRGARTVRAREKARALNAERRQREQQLEDLAVLWFETDEQIVDTSNAAQQKIDKYVARVRSEAEGETGRLRESMNGVVADMLKLAGVRSVAERLGISEAAVREAKVSLEGTSGEPVDSPAPPEPASGQSPLSVDALAEGARTPSA